ncbi:MAG: UDP-2,4-diacetamido-2,4,6-trideoxy-beta-L-altropyranose hydrolase [Oscillospiraceae bacterium]|jgi:UDP-2,4-diacetamido-2,4,6-trideoxy-beta-L-altropyranose hydrolase|nr:UDP-2,4-diacetamido-2,4,6-trideoxy-beta-L-altropyranose hydrolase [Oscillospiraceae bacterium]
MADFKKHSSFLRTDAGKFGENEDLLMLFFRVDGNAEIGSGHVMRCLTIAIELREMGEECIFVTADKTTQGMLEEKRFGTICLHSTWNNLEKEIDDVSGLLQKYKPRAMLIDSYFAPPEYFKKLNNFTKLIYIDDLQEHIENCDMVINYMIECDKDSYRKLYQKDRTKLLLGTEYSPLRSEFKGIKPKEIKKVAKNVLITTGGTDSLNISSKILKRFCNDERFRDLNFVVVVGPLNPNLAELQSLATSNVTLRIAPNKISELMVWGDIVISAGGTTLHELCACGVPTICFSFADNQIACTKVMHNRKIMISVGDLRTLKEETLDNMAENLWQLAQDRSLRANFSKKMRGLTDGSGTHLIALEMLNLIAT